MAKKRSPSALKSLRPDESRAVLDALLNAHPDLVAEAEGLAASMLDDTTWESVADDVESHVAIAAAGGAQRPSGLPPEPRLLRPRDATPPVRSSRKTLAPYLDDIARRLTLGMTAPAHQVAAGVLAGLHACDGEPAATACSGTPATWTTTPTRSSPCWTNTGHHCRTTCSTQHAPHGPFSGTNSCDPTTVGSRSVATTQLGLHQSRC